MYLIMRMRKGKLVINTVEKHSRMFKAGYSRLCTKGKEVLETMDHLKNNREFLT